MNYALLSILYAHYKFCAIKYGCQFRYTYTYRRSLRDAQLRLLDSVTRSIRFNTRSARGAKRYRRKYTSLRRGSGEKYNAFNKSQYPNAYLCNVTDGLVVYRSGARCQNQCCASLQIQSPLPPVQNPYKVYMKEFIIIHKHKSNADDHL